ncbi:sigma factor [Streptomyces uncialis]|uniref:sigma factor n=1 Tax=Streptomyces uncialis TaxID=1048205 RepID=UPI000938A57F|nr:sigma factor [Streptomyces uncialis]MCX4661620.1 hypothetical protein [Streptomyces uncialis]
MTHGTTTARAAHETATARDLSSRAERHCGELRVHCYRTVRSYADAEDLVQETMIRAWRERESPDDPERLRPWLYRIVTRARPDFLAGPWQVPQGCQDSGTGSSSGRCLHLGSSSCLIMATEGCGVGAGRSRLGRTPVSSADWRPPRPPVTTAVGPSARLAAGGTSRAGPASPRTRRSSGCASRPV